MGEYELKIKSNLAKFTTAAALSITAMAAIGSIKTNSTTSHVAAATKKVQVSYVPGYGINVWDNYQNPSFTGKRVQDGTTVNVLASAVDNEGNTWYKIGKNQWIQARYTTKAGKKAKKSKTTTKSAKAVVDLANSQVGKSYAWGASGPSSFDCSGLTQYVYNKAAGKDITRTTYSQVKQGKTVSMKSLKPGDLLFWGSTTSPYHVGVYVGDNQYVHAASPSQGVVKESISTYFYPAVAKRVL